MTAESKIFPTHKYEKSAHELKEGIESYNPGFEQLLPENPKLIRHWRGAEWMEGPAFLPLQNLVVFSDIPNDRMLQYYPATGDTTVFREPANYANGNSVDLEGRLVSAQHLTHGISRTEHDGSVSMMVDRYEGKRLNSPNDLVVKSDGTIWFTDPPTAYYRTAKGPNGIRKWRETSFLDSIRKQENWKLWSIIWIAPTASHFPRTRRFYTLPIRERPKI